MKLHKWAALGLVVALLAVAYTVTGDVAHATLSDPLTIFTANAVLLGLRNDHAALVTRATAKIAEIKDGMPAADVTRIEGEHAELVRQAADIQTKITAEETRSQP